MLISIVFFVASSLVVSCDHHFNPLSDLLEAGQENEDFSLPNVRRNNLDLEATDLGRFNRRMEKRVRSVVKRNGCRETVKYIQELQRPYNLPNYGRRQNKALLIRLLTEECQHELDLGAILGTIGQKSEGSSNFGFSRENNGFEEEQTFVRPTRRGLREFDRRRKRPSKSGQEEEQVPVRKPANRPFRGSQEEEEEKTEELPVRRVKNIGRPSKGSEEGAYEEEMQTRRHLVREKPVRGSSKGPQEEEENESKEEKPSRRPSRIRRPSRSRAHLEENVEKNQFAGRHQRMSKSSEEDEKPRESKRRQRRPMKPKSEEEEEKKTQPDEQETSATVNSGERRFIQHLVQNEPGESDPQSNLKTETINFDSKVLPESDGDYSRTVGTGKVRTLSVKF